jgi:hypothetical protein
LIIYRKKDTKKHAPFGKGCAQITDSQRRYGLYRKRVRTKGWWWIHLARNC